MLRGGGHLPPFLLVSWSFLIPTRFSMLRLTLALSLMEHEASRAVCVFHDIRVLSGLCFRQERVDVGRVDGRLRRPAPVWIK